MGIRPQPPSDERNQLPIDSTTKPRNPQPQRVGVVLASEAPLGSRPP